MTRQIVYLIIAFAVVMAVALLVPELQGAVTVP